MLIKKVKKIGKSYKKMAVSYKKMVAFSAKFNENTHENTHEIVCPFLQKKTILVVLKST